MTPGDPLDSLPGSNNGVPIVCPTCGGFFIVNREELSEDHVTCVQCWASLPRALVRQGHEQARLLSPDVLNARTAPVRLHWLAGYVSEYPGPLDDDTRAVTLNEGTGIVTLHARTGAVCSFLDSGIKDEDGYTIYREILFEEQADHIPGPRSRAFLPVAETFDYVTNVPADGIGVQWSVRSREPVDGTGPQIEGPRLVGSSPRLRVEPVGLLQGGGPLSPMSALSRPTVLASRIVLTAHDRADATASAASFHLDQGLVDALRPGDEVNLTRTPRGGLGLSVIRAGELLVAVGVATAVPVGLDLRVVVRRDRVVKASAPTGRPIAEMPWLHPIEFTSLGRVPRKPKGYRMQVWCSPWPSPEDTDENVSIIRGGVYPEFVAFSSAHLLAVSDALHVGMW